MYSESQLELLNQLRLEGMYLPSGAFNASFSKKFKNSITPERKEWFDSIPGDSLSEKVYNLTKNSPMSTCKVCGGSVKFISPKEGYRTYCSSSCRAKGEMTNVANTNMLKYGAKAPAQNKEIQKKMQKTTQERYGVNNIFERTDLIKDAVMEKYGVENVMSLASIREDLRKSNIEKYGKEHTTAVPEFIAKRRETNLLRYGNASSLHGKDIATKISLQRKRDFYGTFFTDTKFTSKAIPLFFLEEYEGTIDSEKQAISYPWTCIRCNNDFTDYLAYNRGPRCPYCYPHDGTEGLVERELRTWLQDEFPNKKVIRGDRTLVRPQEIDIYFPEEKFAIEFNEIGWHCEKKTKGVRGEKYHLNKTKVLKEKGIELIHILDSEWIDSQEIVKSIIRARFGVFSSKLGARVCKVKKVSSSECRVFLDNNHIQGYAPASISYGLYHEEELVSLLCLGKNRFKKGTYEVVRFVSRINTQVMGGLSRLWKEARREIPEDATLISYVDLRLFHGKSNENLGLKYQYTNSPSFSYTNDYKTLYNRMAFQKGVLHKKLPIFDQNLTEWENMQANGYDRIWDCGTAVYST